MTAPTDLPRPVPPLSIGPWTDEAIAAVRPHLTGGEWKNWDAPYYPPLSQAEVPAYVDRLRADPWQRDPATGVPMRLAAGVDGRTVGVLAWHWEDRSAGWRRIGIVLYGGADWGRGLGRGLLGAWVDWLFSLPDTHRVDLATWSGNERMARLAQALGFAEEARLRGARVVRGERYDGLVFGRLRRA